MLLRAVKIRGRIAISYRHLSDYAPRKGSCGVTLRGRHSNGARDSAEGIRHDQVLFFGGQPD